MRLEISEYAAAGWNDTQIAMAIGCSVWIESLVATTMAKARARRLHLADGPPCHWPGEYLSSRLKGGHPAPAHETGYWY